MENTEGRGAGNADSPDRRGNADCPGSGSTGASDADERRLAGVVHAAFLLLLGSSFVRFLNRDQAGSRTAWVVGLFVAFALLYALGHLLAPPPRAGTPPSARHLVWLASVSALWAAMLALAPSATWCAMPLLFAGLYALPPRVAVPLAAVLTALVVVSEVRASEGPLNPNMVVAPIAVAAVATAVFVHLQRQGARQRALIDDLVRTRRDLAATERRAGVLAERQRLSAEIHDTLAQGLSSQGMLLQAAQRVWATDPETARAHVREAAGVTARSLAEARRFVHDLAPADLAGQSLPAALAALAERESGPGLTVGFRLDGNLPGPLPERTEAALLRIAQGALANVREHAAATRAALTLTCLDEQISLDVADNGRGFDPALTALPAPPALTPPAAVPAPPALPVPAAVPGPEGLPGPEGVPIPAARPTADPGRTRGHGLPAMRIRARQSGGTLTVESTPGEGTVVTAAIPLEVAV